MSLSLRFSFASASRSSRAVRKTRLPLLASVSVAVPLRFNSLTVAEDGSDTDALLIVTKLSAAGTPLGLQLAAVDQLPPLAGPTQVLPRVSSLRMVPTPCPSAIVPSPGWLRL